ncbi:MAG: HAD-IA family hydrolase [Candidatus Poribacteria bacterium]|nr:HAD-IA family hydrolase [Candidatus Poribacteria bacterium]
MIKAVFFDFYKTLFVHEEQSFERSLRKIAAQYGVEINWERFETAMERLFASTSAPAPPTDYSLLESSITVMMRECEFIRELGVQEHVEQMAWELLQFAGHPLFGVTNATLYDDVVPTLEHLRDVGFKLAIVSNWDTPLDPLTERLGIAKYFDAIVASHDARVQSEKPDPHIFNYALAAVGVSAEEVIHVGDTYEADIVGARDVGIRPILLDRDGTQAGRWDETIQSLAKLPELLDG